MDEQRIHLFVTYEGEDGYSVESPQVPGFAMGRRTAAEIRSDIKGALRFAGVPGGRRLELHDVQRFDTADGDEYTVRVAAEPDEPERRASRLETFRRLVGVLSTDQRRGLLKTARSSTDEVAFVVALPTDTLGWLAEQLYDEHDVSTIVVPVAEEHLFTTSVGTGLREGWTSLAERGWSAETTVSEVMQGLAKAPSEQRLLTLT